MHSLTMSHDQYTTTVLEVNLLKAKAVLENVKASEIRRPCLRSSNLLILNGGQRRDRTADAGLFRAALYH
jgi:hypothetical protein